MNVYLKSEPSGEICCGKLTDEDVSLFKELYDKEEISTSKFVDTPFEFYDICSAFGLFTNLDEEEFDDYEVEFKQVKKVSLSKDESDDGFYLVYTSLDKCSVDFDLDDEEQSDKLIFEYKTIDLKDIKTDLYGSISYNIIENCQYKKEYVDDFEVLDRGSLTNEIQIVQIKDKQMSVVYKFDSDGDEYYGDFI